MYRWALVSPEELEQQAQGQEVGEADPQTAGSLTTTQVAMSYMGKPETHQPVSVMFAKETREAVADGEQVVMHRR